MKNLHHLTLFAAALALSVPGSAQTYYAVLSPDQGFGQLDVIDAGTGAVNSSTTCLLDGNAFDGFTGMARNPGNGMLYVIAKDGSTFTLGTLDPMTGAVTSMATLPDKFAGITFGNGFLYGITGDGATDASRIFIIDPSNGNTANVIAPGGGDDGEAIAFNPNDGLLYRYGGGTTFQTIDPGNLNVVNIGLSATPPNYAHALLYEAATNSFLFWAGDILYRVDTSGNLTSLQIFSGDIGNNGAKGLAFTSQVGIGETVAAGTLDMYPVPADAEVSILVPADATVSTLRVVDAAGVQIAEERITAVGTHVFNTAELPAGLYTFHLLSGDQRWVQRVVVNH